MTRYPILLLVLSGLLSCQGHPIGEDGTEAVSLRQVSYDIEVPGSLVPADETTIVTPGLSGSAHLIEWIVPDGSNVKKGDVVARFSPLQALMEERLANIEIEKLSLAKHDHLDEIKHRSSTSLVGISEVNGQLVISNRYAGAKFGAIARNDVLDAVQDIGFLNLKKSVLMWQNEQDERQATLELRSFDRQRRTFQDKLLRSQQDLTAMEARASVDGPVILQRDWTGAIPHVSATLYGGNPLATQSNSTNMVVVFNCRVADSYDLRLGDAVYVSAIGSDRPPLLAHISWIADSSQPISAESPERFRTFRVSVTSRQAVDSGWVVGQDLIGDVSVKSAKPSVSVPNIALLSENGESLVWVVDEHGKHRQAVKVGRRGPARSEVLSGLTPGTRVVLFPNETAVK